jgi:hypothetical protein
MPAQRRGSDRRCRSPKQVKCPRRRQGPSSAASEARVQEALDRVRELFSEQTVDRLRRETGYNRRKRVATAHRLLLVVVEAFLAGVTLGFNPIRAFFVRHYGQIRARAFQLRFKSICAVLFFKAALDDLVSVTCSEMGLDLQGPLSAFDDVHVFDGTGQRVPPRGAKNPALKGCTKGKAGSKWVVGYSLRSGVAFSAASAAETHSELKLWRNLVPAMLPNVLYLLDLGFFCREMYQEANRVGAHVLMRLKSGAKVRVRAHVREGRLVSLPDWSLSYYLSGHPRRRGTTLDIDVIWGRGSKAMNLRLVGYFAGGRKGWRFYLTTIPREVLSAEQIVQAYRLRYLIEFLFREWKQQADLGRSFTADRNALDALTYGAMLSHALVRSLRIVTALRRDIPLEQLRPLACLHAIRPFGADIFTALACRDSRRWNRLVDEIGDCMLAIAHEKKPSKSRPRIARALGAWGA